MPRPVRTRGAWRPWMDANDGGSVAPGAAGWPTIPIGKTAALNWFAPWCPCHRSGGRCAGCAGARPLGARPAGASRGRGSRAGRRGRRGWAVGHGADVTGAATAQVHLLAAGARDRGAAGDLAGGPFNGIGPVPDRFGRHRARQGRCRAAQQQPRCNKQESWPPAWPRCRQGAPLPGRVFVQRGRGQSPGRFLGLGLGLEGALGPGRALIAGHGAWDYCPLSMAGPQPGQSGSQIDHQLPLP